MLINDILDLSKVESGKMNAYVNEFQLNILAGNIESSFKHITEEKGLKLIIKINKTLPATIKSDQQKLEQIIKNFMSNAIKFTAHGSVRLTIGRPPPNFKFFRSELNPENSIIISVEDTGIGIPEENQGKIFQAFQQANDSTSNDYGGTGLGLSISRELAKLLGGEIQIRSALGQGTAFTLIIPLELKVTGNIENDKRTAKRSPVVLSNNSTFCCELLTGKKMLIVDDDMRSLFALSKILQDKGADVYKAANSEKAIKILENESEIDVLLLDVMMPGVDGCETLRRIKAQEYYKNIPIIALTTNAMKDDYEKCISAGANEYLSKPIDLDRLFLLINRLFNIK